MVTNVSLCMHVHSTLQKISAFSLMKNILIASQSLCIFFLSFFGFSFNQCMCVFFFPLVPATKGLFTPK